MQWFTLVFRIKMFMIEVKSTSENQHLCSMPFSGVIAKSPNLLNPIKLTSGQLMVIWGLMVNY